MPATINLISPAALAELCKQRSIKLIDVRTPGEFEQLHAQGATNIPLDEFDAAAALSGCDDALYVICRAGNRAQKACEKLVAANPGVRIVNVDGGTLAWEGAGLPVVRGRKRMSLDRQVRIGAGSLVILSILLSIFVHSGFIGLAGLVGAGLVLAGMTDWCGMGMVLGKMPWNRRTKATCETPNAT
jgi:rhodanese-related sulfurtransferase